MWYPKFALAAASVLSLTLLGGSADAASFFIDFSRTDANGAITASPDSNGNHWNNLASNGFEVPVGLTLSDLVDTQNNASTIDVETTSVVNGPSFRANGDTVGGLTNPDPSLLGDFAIADATRDYFFVEGSQNTGNPNDPSGLIFSQLNPDATYDFRFFGTRVTGSYRESRHTVIGGNKTEFVTLVTSGTDVGTDGYDGNNDTIVEIKGITPDANNEIQYLLSVVQGNYAYISAMEVTETMNVPEPTSALLLGGCGVVAACCWRRRRNAR
ncbi:hypothetical protein NG895_14220 [Aeoliella sp. ICT_H6.2]|uniref:PEP-CTERM protein-sorting domain-containing protein n=1 Tax=Aeoliella straminimaris TaxID=2954799 RepID=A0A9X2F9U6_9BACT|nr:hypothetical protein [Aeoliella straminimaris]MCO6045062.1 hypothetical protein [Aeoliella straminimaris]